MSRSRNPGAGRLRAPGARRWGLIVLSASLLLSACQRPAQELPQAPVFAMPPTPPTPPRQVPPPPPPVRAAPPEFRPFIGPTVIQFEGDSVQLDPAARAILDQQAEWLLRNPGASVVLRGHADLFGSRARQFAIGEMRAAAMRRHLVARGVSPARIAITSFGKQQPLATARDEESQRRNRRGETIFRGVAGPSIQ